MKPERLCDMSDVAVLELSEFADRFELPARIEGLSKVNFIYGKNGTGKSTICDAVRNAFGVDYDVRIFQGFDKLLAGSVTLDAFALGVENVEIQEKVDSLRRDIETLTGQIDTEAVDENIGKQLSRATDAVSTARAAISSFVTSQAKHIKNLTDPQVAKTSYDKNDFLRDIQTASPLEPSAYSEAVGILTTGLLSSPSSVTFPRVDLESETQVVNELLQRSIGREVVLAEIGDNVDKQHFAKRGMQIHSRKTGERCAFCGSEISENRWELLDGYISKAETALESALSNEIAQLTGLKEQIEQLDHVPLDGFYPPFTSRVDELNRQIDDNKQNLLPTLRQLIKALESRQHDIYKVKEQVSLNASSDFSDIEADLADLLQENEEFSTDIERRRAQAKRQLLLHEVWKSLQEGTYSNLQQQLNEAEASQQSAQESVDAITQKIRDKRAQQSELLEQTRDETKAVKSINHYLTGIGNSSFTLVLEQTPEHGQGYYSIQSTSGRRRPITELSTGEKNIIAFLYFMQKLQSDDGTNSPKMVVLDDPMNSNDDTVQFLMMGVIKQYYDPSQQTPSSTMGADDMLIVLTHNTYFYLNVRPYQTRYRDIIRAGGKQINNPYRYFHLRKNGEKTSIQRIFKEDQDIKTAYDSLWSDLRFAYDNDRPGFMWNSMRRIISTFAEFNGMTFNSFLEKTDSVIDNTLGCALHKGLNTNSHELLDLEFDSSSCTREQMIQFLHDAFEKLDYEAHFNKYWPNYNARN